MIVWINGTWRAINIRYYTLIDQKRQIELKKIRIFVGNLAVHAVLNDTKTAQAIWEKLPISAKGNVWGDEIYFPIPVKAGAENPVPLVSLGDLAYWMPGSAFCIFYGQTPSSCKGEIRPASPVNIVGKIDLEFIEDLKRTKDGEKVTIEKVEQAKAGPAKVSSDKWI